MDKAELLKLMGVESEEDFQLAVLESIGRLALILHWVRGTLYFLQFHNLITFPNDELKANYERLLGNMEAYEQFVWEVAPSRAALLGLRNLRCTGQMPEDIVKLLEKDPHGRIPFGMTDPELDDIKDILRRLGAARSAQSRVGAGWNQESLQAAVDRLGPWHYWFQFPHGVVTGTSGVTLPEKMPLLIKAGAFSRPQYPRVLDVGANAGQIAMWFVDNKASTVTAIERGPKYFPQLELAVELLGYTTRIVPVNADIVDWEPKPGVSYDLVNFLGTLHHLPEQTHLDTLRKLLKVLYPGGEIVVQTRTALPVGQLLGQAGFIHVRKLDYAQDDRSAWIAMRDPMKVR